MYLVSAEEMKKMDDITINTFGLPGRVLMENAGLGATRIFLSHLSRIRHKRICVLAGRGNNGGDGFVIARHLNSKGFKTKVYLLTDKIRVKGDAAANLELLDKIKLPVVEISDEESFSSHRDNIAKNDIIIDAILGTGLSSPVTGLFETVIRFVNMLKRPVFAVDIPSGLDADTGKVCGVAIKATCTATFAFAKTGHFLYPGNTCTGKLEIVDIGIPPHIYQDSPPAQHLITRDYIASCLPQRPHDAHKGTTGHLLITGGSPGKSGAAAMTGLGALRCGCGLVTIGVPSSLHQVIETLLLEAMTVSLDETSDGTLAFSSTSRILELLHKKKCIALGPGMGTGQETVRLVHGIVEESQVPVVVDADGLNCLCRNISILSRAKAPVILTPHPGEMARLIDSSPEAVQKDRIRIAKNFAKSYNVHLVLKGAETIIAHPDGTTYINPTGNSGMASGGMGDLLTGIIAGFIAQGIPLKKSIHSGVYIHGLAADTLHQKCPFGFTASDLSKILPEEIGRILS